MSGPGMAVLLTGANGFVGRALLRRLLSHGLGGRPVASLVASDLNLEDLPADARIRPVAGSIAEAGVLERALAAPVDAVFHLASVPGGAAEQAPDTARRVNLDATLRLVDLLRAQGGAPRLVFASTVAVYGDPLPAWVDDATPAQPALSYGAHKLAAEVLLADADRRGWVQACSLRLPGIVARPGDGAGLMSAFMSQLFWKLRDGQPLVLPVSACGTAWWLSVQACVDNLLLAACLDTARLGPRRVVQVPALHLSMQQVIAALARICGPGREALVRFEPQAQVQRLFAGYPPLHTPAAHALGFRHDGSADELVRRALTS
ncbi:NAD-dependent epimerase/dehydratase family protein [Roseateles sp. LYH14W]|uniref:NAD-dependent epimerase/dehydratase family protein n=1 Tax=Pelomonas parva TaxID=3299032 RepID=A0ABW7EZV5_9BURK